MKRSSLLIILNLIAAIAYLAVSLVTGSLAHVDTSVFSSHDSLEYRAVADWIFGAQPSATASNWRPFLYPLLIGIAERLGGIRGVWLLNAAFWFVALNFAAAATHRFVRSNLAMALVFVVLATNISLILLTFEGLTEITVVALLAAWAYGLARFTRRSTPSRVAWVVLPVALIVVVKPEFEPLLLVVVVASVIAIVNSPARGPAGASLAACLVPIAIQVAVMIHFHGYFGISSIGDSTLRGYFLSRLDIAIGGASSLVEARSQMIGLSNSDAARLVVGHLYEAASVFLSTLKENLLAGSNFLRDHPRIAHVIVVTQWTYFVALLAMIPLTLVALWRARDGRLALLCLATLNVFLAGGLTFYQGDRITIVALPLWLIGLALAIQEAGGPGLWTSIAARWQFGSSAPNRT